MKWKLSSLIGILAAVCIPLGIAIALLVASPASANSPPPPFMNWFSLTYPSGQTTLQGLQIVDCSTATCEKPVLLIQYGECRDTGCLTSPAIFAQRGDRFDCFDDRCLWLGSALDSFPINAPQQKDEPKKWFRLIGQFADRLRLSAPILKGETTSFPMNGVWQVEVTSDSMQMAQKKGIISYSALSPFQEYSNRMFWSSWLLTILLELLVAWLFLWWRKASQQTLSRTLVAIAMVNLFSYPVVWIFFPSLEPFQSVFSRYFGISSLAIAMLYGLMMHVESKVSSRKLIFDSFIILIGANIIGFFVALCFGYGRWEPIVEGIPYRFTLPASEIFAVVYEAWVIATLSLGQLSFKQAGLLSLLTNATSLLLGVILFSFTSNL
ncbi:hypothetical protein V2H45_25150 [Tumidithrix elongata RA019]|uniref:Uncharacterized protein n=1 Tax=Tumidithrix elongata BACA0141 TaxID=2716417 RepID=A0AAW9Q7T7_9CYAN|nr:hypothetical protein [Tumidithrix elongata RA019]